ncbi:MAG TPA: hypothetical protein VHR86_06660, partial [Armatimonadota bacterium]|nr:hypothetical protein [Armatimonadota bacterium]
TLWCAIKQGRLSAHREADKSYRIDESELLRVFPDAGKQQAGNSDSLDLPSHATLQIDTLKTQIDLLQRQLEDMQRDKQWLMQRIETLEATQQRLLPPPRRELLSGLPRRLLGLGNQRGGLNRLCFWLPFEFRLQVLWQAVKYLLLLRYGAQLGC